MYCMCTSTGASSVEADAPTSHAARARETDTCAPARWGSSSPPSERCRRLNPARTRAPCAPSLSVASMQPTVRSATNGTSVCAG
eukprot:scaffold10022_cov79-Isochrysis_galbana.AAC.1